MRARVLAPLLLALAGSVCARAEDAPPPAVAPTIEARAADLASAVTALRATLDDLEKRLEALEEAFDREESGALDEDLRRPKPKPKPKPKPSPEPEAPEAGSAGTEEAAPAEEAPAADEEGEPEEEGGLDPAIAELVGTYRMDTEAFIEAMTTFLRDQLAAELGDVPPEIVDGAIEAMRQQLASTVFELDLRADLTWEARNTIDGESLTASGTWERDGEDVTLHQTHENGEAMDEPVDLEGVWDGTTLRLEPGEAIPVQVFFIKADD